MQYLHPKPRLRTREFPRPLDHDPFLRFENLLTSSQDSGEHFCSCHGFITKVTAQERDAQGKVWGAGGVGGVHAPFS